MTWPCSQGDVGQCGGSRRPWAWNLGIPAGQGQGRSQLSSSRSPDTGEGEAHVISGGETELDTTPAYSPPTSPWGLPLSHEQWLFPRLSVKHEEPCLLLLI